MSKVCPHSRTPPSVLKSHLTKTYFRDLGLPLFFYAKKTSTKLQMYLIKHLKCWRKKSNHSTAMAGTYFGWCKEFLSLSFLSTFKTEGLMSAAYPSGPCWLVLASLAGWLSVCTAELQFGQWDEPSVWRDSQPCICDGPKTWLNYLDVMNPVLVHWSVSKWTSQILLFFLV